MIPLPDIAELLFTGPLDEPRIIEFIGDDSYVNIAKGLFAEINWLNTPGPIYTTHTDNCGTGQVAAMNNVGGDENYHEVIFKQPFSRQELKETLTAAAIDPFDAYYFDGNTNWTTELIHQWWAKSKERITYILDNYEHEIKLPDILDRPLYGPRNPIPENYKSWLDFYQNDMKNYLEWYSFKLSGQQAALAELNVDWKRKEELDKVLEEKKNNKK
jgi:hypothetical protein